MDDQIAPEIVTSGEIANGFEGRVLRRPPKGEVSEGRARSRRGEGSVAVAVASTQRGRRKRARRGGEGVHCLDSGRNRDRIQGCLKIDRELSEAEFLL